MVPGADQNCLWTMKCEVTCEMPRVIWLIRAVNSAVNSPVLSGDGKRDSHFFLDKTCSLPKYNISIYHSAHHLYMCPLMQGSSIWQFCVRTSNKVPDHMGFFKTMQYFANHFLFRLAIDQRCQWVMEKKSRSKKAIMHLSATRYWKNWTLSPYCGECGIK